MRGLARRMLRRPRRERLDHLARLCGLRRTQDVEGWQARRLTARLARTRQEVPFYDQAPTSLRGWPIVDKATVASHFGAMTSRRRHTGVHEVRTSGSTGVPGRFLHDARSASWDWAALRCTMAWAGYQEGDGMVKFVRHAKRLRGLPRMVQAGREWFGNERYALGYGAVDEAVEKQRFRMIQKVRPRYLRGYPTAMVRLASMRLEEDLPLPPLRGILSTGSALRDPDRKMMETGFQAPVFDHYGSRELGPVAAECPEHDGLHVFPDHVVELLDGDGEPVDPGQQGRVVVTSLRHDIMPLIRYDTGDVASWAEGTCDCGLGWPRLRSVAGRAGEVFVDRRGRMVPPDLVINFMAHEIGLDDVEQYQVVQEDQDRFVVRIVPRRGRGIEGAAWRRLEAYLRSLFGAECQVEQEIVRDVPTAPSGKRFYSVCHVDHPWRRPPGRLAGATR